MRLSGIVLLLLLAPGLFLPLGLRMNFCLCGDGHAGQDVPRACARMHCCADPTPQGGDETAPLVSAPPCAGCRSLVAPPSPSTSTQTSSDLGPFVHPPELGYTPLIVPNDPPIRASSFQVGVRGPPVFRSETPLRI